MSGYDVNNDSMLDMYLFESVTLLNQLDEILLESEKSRNLSPENIDEIFRIMHTIKGSSAMMEFETITHVSHKVEDLFFIIRQDGINDSYFNSLFDLVLKVSDYLKEEVDKIQQGQMLETNNALLLSEIDVFVDEIANTQSVLTDETSTIDDQSLLTNTSELEDSPVTTNISLDNLYNIHVRFTADCQMENIRAYMLINKITEFGVIVATIPSEISENKEASSIISNNGFYISFTTDSSKAEIENSVNHTLSVESCRFIEKMPNNQQAAIQTQTKAPSNTKSIEDTSLLEENANQSSSNSMKSVKQNLINVNLNKLDDLMNLVGEIVITESMVSGNSDLDGLNLESFNKASHQLRKLTDELQDMVMSIRMVPIAATFQKMKRIVRDMSKKLSKEVELVLIGEATEVDKTIIDGIADPLMHLVRNSMDHGIESPAERIAAGKDPNGQIVLSAQNVGGEIIISVSDNGKGLDPLIILEKAKEKGLLTKPESEMTEKEIFNLLTVAGFSTKDAVSEFSGRGVGMDVVKQNIEKIGGTVTIESKKGIGTNIYFKIPLTLAIIASLEITVGDRIFAIPMASMRESFKVNSSQLFSDPAGNEMIMIRGACYPIIRLHELFKIEDCVTDIEKGIILLVDSGDSLACVFADELIGKHQVVVKPLPIFLNRFSVKGSGIAGCTILGDGSVSLILDVQGILNLY